MKVYETITKNNDKLRFEYDDSQFSYVEVYVNNQYWGSPQGCRFLKQLLFDLEKGDEK